MVKVKGYFHIQILYRENVYLIYTGGSVKVPIRKLGGSLDAEEFYGGRNEHSPALKSLPVRQERGSSRRRPNPDLLMDGETCAASADQSGKTPHLDSVHPVKAACAVLVRSFYL